MTAKPTLESILEDLKRRDRVRQEPEISEDWEVVRIAEGWMVWHTIYEDGIGSSTDCCAETYQKTKKKAIAYMREHEAKARV